MFIVSADSMPYESSIDTNVLKKTTTQKPPKTWIFDGIFLGIIWIPDGKGGNLGGNSAEIYKYFVNTRERKIPIKSIQQYLYKEETLRFQAIQNVYSICLSMLNNSLKSILYTRYISTFNHNNCKKTFEITPKFFTIVAENIYIMKMS